MVGLDASGKTSLLYRWKLGEVVTSIPTIGFNVETVEVDGWSLNVWDVGGKDKIRPLWAHYYENCVLVIFVVDSNDHDRMDQAKEEIQKMMREEGLRNAVLLVLANKQDLAGALPADEIADLLDLGRAERPWHIQGTSVVTGFGLDEAISFMKEATVNGYDYSGPAIPVTLHADRNDTTVSLSCTSMAGMELAAFSLSDAELQTTSISDLRRLIAEKSGRRWRSLKLILADGSVPSSNSVLARLFTAATPDITTTSTNNVVGFSFLTWMRKCIPAPALSN